MADKKKSSGYRSPGANKQLRTKKKQLACGTYKILGCADSRDLLASVADLENEHLWYTFGTVATCCFSNSLFNLKLTT